MRKLIVFNAGLSVPSTTRMLAERIANAVDSQVSSLGNTVHIDIVDIRDYATDLAALMTTGIPTAALQKVQEEVTAADGMIAATPVFAASFSGLFKMFIDSLDTDAINGMPVIIAATAGTLRHSLVLEYAMRPLFSYLRADVVATGIFAATEDFGAASEPGEADQLEARINRAAGQLANLMVEPSAGVGAGAKRPQKRSSGTTVSSDVIDFEDLLRGHDGTQQIDSQET